MARIIFSVLMVIFIGISSYAEVSPGNNVNDEQTDFETLVNKAKAGDPKACFLAGVLASKIPESQSIGKQLLEKGAELGNPDCLAALGQASEQGIFGETDLAKALKYYKRGAEMNHSISMLKLSNMYREGKGTSQDYKLSGKWAMKAAKCGLRRACINVGLQYMMGWGTEKNMTKAFVFYHIAGVEDEIAKAQAFLIYEKLSTEEKLKAEEIMMKWEKIFPPPPENSSTESAKLPDSAAPSDSADDSSSTEPQKKARIINPDIDPDEMVRAIDDSDTDKVKDLIERGIALDWADDQNRNYLMRAIHFKQMDIIKALIDAKIDINATDNMNMTALHHAACENLGEAVPLLVDAGLNVDVPGFDSPNDGPSESTPLHMAAQSHALDAAKALIEAGANVNALTNVRNGKFRRSPLFWAEKSHDSEIAELLQSYGAEKFPDGATQN